ncbi:hypothetical protein SAMN02194393_01785 [Maledivibacter halophilus]|uniref:Uncharacterized protein n=1 Tax=Maledivibacter halophilus TaxID=36842 RepID=A0A1T5KGD9_9FIRM|nr:hypothetical protein SAMN02194393_01785 [Maledivibacter halophilus]
MNPNRGFPVIIVALIITAKNKDSKTLPVKSDKTIAKISGRTDKHRASTSTVLGMRYL